MLSVRMFPALVATLVAAASPAVQSQPLCRPAIAPRTAQSSAVLNQQRRWTAMFAVDASRCATDTGTFDVGFVREKELGPDLAFTERFIWSPERTEIAMDLWWDEWIRSYRVVTIAACPCRDARQSSKAFHTSAAAHLERGRPLARSNPDP